MLVEVCKTIAKPCPRKLQEGTVAMPKTEVGEEEEGRLLGGEKGVRVDGKGMPRQGTGHR